MLEDMNMHTVRKGTGEHSLLLPSGKVVGKEPVILKTKSYIDKVIYIKLCVYI